MQTKLLKLPDHERSQLPAEISQLSNGVRFHSHTRFVHMHNSFSRNAESLAVRSDENALSRLLRELLCIHDWNVSKFDVEGRWCERLECKKCLKVDAILL